MPDEPHPERTPLDDVQRWMQAVIMHPGGVVEGINSTEAQRHVSVIPEMVESVVSPSQALSSIDRLEIYSQAYFSRLMECLQAEFPILVQAMGEELFDAFAIDYLQSYPSRSYTLNRLGADFARFLTDTRPAADPDSDEGSGWPDFLIGLAELEWTFSEVFDGPGVEKTPLLDGAQLERIPPERWPEARLVPVPCLRLLALRFPVHRYYSALREKQEPLPPEPADTFLAITRRNYIVRHYELTPPQFELLTALTQGATVAEAIQRVAPPTDEALEQFAAELQDWFRRWSAEGYFLGVSDE